MKRILLTLLGIVIVLGLFAAVGFTGYRLGYVQGAQTTANSDASQLRPFDEVGPRGMRDFGFPREFQRGFGVRGFPVMGFGFFFLLRWLGRIFVLALIVWFLFWLFTRNGWRLTREPVSSPPPVTPPSSGNE